MLICLTIDFMFEVPLYNERYRYSSMQSADGGNNPQSMTPRSYVCIVAEVLELRPPSRSVGRGRQCSFVSMRESTDICMER